jgi:hypothetical protein
LHSTVSLEYIDKNLDKPWDWHVLSSSPKLTSEFVKKHVDKPWCWDKLYLNRNILIQFQYPNTIHEHNIFSQDLSLIVKMSKIIVPVGVSFGLVPKIRNLLVICFHI